MTLVWPLYNKADSDAFDESMKKLNVLFITLMLVFSLLVWMAGERLSSAAHTKMGAPPSSLKVESIANEHIQAWYVHSNEHTLCLLLMHGIRANRSDMIGRAEFLKRAGYSVLAIDLQAHGEAPGEKMTFGHLESESARRAAHYLYQEKNCPKVVALGSSLGGAASLLGKEPLKVDGYILEAVYPHIVLAVENRLKIRFGAPGKLLAPLLYLQIPWRLGLDLDSLSPAHAIRKIEAPVLVINGDLDQRTTVNEARLLYKNAPSPKVLYVVKGAAHTDLYEYDRASYEETVLGFLRTHIDLSQKSIAK